MEPTEYPKLRSSYYSRLVTDTFLGYNHNLKIGDGEFFDMENLTGDYYPLMANRGKRGTVAQLTAPHALLGKSSLAYIDGDKLYYGGQDLTEYLLGAGASISDDPAMLPKQLVSMGAYIVIFPDKLYINTENYTDCGRLEAHFSTPTDSAVNYTLCRADGTDYGTPVISATAPPEPQNGDLWMDSSGAIHTLRQYNAQSAMWVEIPTVYVRIEAPGIGAQFARYDGVTIAGCAADTTAVNAQVAELNGSKIIYQCGQDYIVVVGLLDQAYTQTAGSVSVSRTMPDVDFLTEASNRLWGCKYGLVNGKTVNEIYCCVLGDFKNWNRFLGLSTDSYVASVGTDGPWTGSVTYLGYPIFFKENCLHKVYVSGTGAHQIVDTACRGVQQGSHRSLAVVNETLLYHTAVGICAYDGSLPVSVSDVMGGERYFNAVGGALGDKYYVSMEDRDGASHLFVYDSRLGLWHREDSTKVLQFARCGGELYYIDEDTHALMCVTGSMGISENDVHWCAVTGIMGYDTVEQKYISRFNLRMKLAAGAYMDVFVQYDSDGVWEPAGHIEGTGTKTFLLPVRPRRCDHFQIKLEGCGDVRLYSFAKNYEGGSDEVWQTI